MTDLTQTQIDKMAHDDRLTQIVAALIGQRVTSSTVIAGGTSKGGAAQIAADARAIMVALGDS